MADIFLNLTIQSLSSSAEIQPLISPLFAPAPQLVSDAPLSPLDSQTPEGTEIRPSSVLSERTADDEMTGTWEMESLSQESMPATGRPALPNLVPFDVPGQSISTLSIRHLLHAQHTAYKDMESVTAASQPSVVAPASNEAPVEDRAAFPFSEDTSVDADVSRPAQRPVSTLAQETSLSQSGVEHIVKHEEYTTLSSRPLQTDPSTPSTFPTIQPLSPALAAPLQSPQLPSSSEPAMKTDAPQQHVSPMPVQQTPIAPDQHSEVPPRPIDRARTFVAHPLLHQPLHHIENSGQRKEVASRLFIDANEPIVQPVVTADAADSTQPSILSKASPVQNVMPVIVSRGNQTTQATVVNNRSGESEASPPPVESEERGLIPTMLSPSEGLHSPAIFTMQEARVAREELEVSPVRVTIGRVVVRATPATPVVPPAQKRVLRPAQSLSEYLKQRERGSR